MEVQMTAAPPPPPAAPGGQQPPRRPEERLITWTRSPESYRRAAALRTTPGSHRSPAPMPHPLTWSLNASSVTSFRLMSTLKYAPNMPVSRALAATCNRSQERSWPAAPRTHRTPSVPQGHGWGPHASSVVPQGSPGGTGPAEALAGTCRTAGSSPALQTQTTTPA